MTASFWTSSSVRVWTADRFERRAEGKAVGFEVVVMALEDVSKQSHQGLCIAWSEITTSAVPLFSFPHTSHFKTAVASPEDPSSRLPQSVQNTSDPIAAIAMIHRHATLRV